MTIQKGKRFIFSSAEEIFICCEINSIFYKDDGYYGVKNMYIT